MVPPPRGMSSGLVSPEEEQEEVDDMVSAKGQRGPGSTETQAARKVHTPGQNRRKPSSGACGVKQKMLNFV